VNASTRLLSLVVDGLKHLDLSIKYGLVDQPKIRKLFLEYLLNYLLLPYEWAKPPAATTTNQQTPAATAQTDATETQASNTNSEIPGCMSEKLYKQFKNDVNLEDIEALEQAKVAILKFLSLNIYSNEDAAFHYIIASSDPRFKYTVTFNFDSSPHSSLF
jgi:Proteasome stabiliser